MLGPQTDENQSGSQMSKQLYQLLKSLRNARRTLRRLLIYREFFLFSVCAERFPCRLRIDVTGPSALSGLESSDVKSGRLLIRASVPCSSA